MTRTDWKELFRDLSLIPIAFVVLFLYVLAGIGKIVKENPFMKITAIIAAVLIYALTLTGCPAAKTIADAKKASIKIATNADIGVNLTRDLYRSNFISIGDKDRIADAFIGLSKAGIAFDKTIANAEAVYGSTVPQAELDKIFLTFNSEIIDEYLAIVALIKPLQHAGEYGRIIDLIKTAILAVAKGFGKHSEVSVKLAPV